MKKKSTIVRMSEIEIPEEKEQKKLKMNVVKMNEIELPEVKPKSQICNPKKM